MSRCFIAGRQNNAQGPPGGMSSVSPEGKFTDKSAPQIRTACFCSHLPVPLTAGRINRGNGGSSTRCSDSTCGWAKRYLKHIWEVPAGSNFIVFDLRHSIFLASKIICVSIRGRIRE